MRTATVLLLLAVWAAAQDLVVRVTVGDEPVEGAAVQVQPARDGGPTFRVDKFAPDARTDATGQALVQATSKHQVLVYFPGYELAVVQGGGQVADVALRPERVFSGRVVDTSGDPIVGATVILRTTFRRKAAFPVVSGEEGKFHVFGLWFDDFALRIEAPGFVPWRSGDLTEEANGTSFFLKRFATMAGTITDHRGEVVAGAEVHVGAETTRTSDIGAYRIGRLEPGVEYWVQFPTPWGGHAGPIVLEDGEVREGIDVVRLGPATITLRVVDNEGRGLEGVGGEPPLRFGGREVASDAEGRIAVHIRPENSTELYLRAENREAITVQVPRLRPGVTQDLGDIVLPAVPEIEVRVRLPDGAAAAAGTVGDIPLVDGVARVNGAGPYEIAVPGYPAVFPDIAPPGPVLVTLATPLWIEGTVLDTEGGPVVGARVTAAAGEVDVAPVESDGEGRFRIGPFNEGTVQVQASTATACSRSVDVVLGDGELELTVVATKPDLLRGRVLRGIRPVTRFRIKGTRFVDEEGRFEVLLRRAERDWIEIHAAGGSFPFRLPPEGQELVARLPAGRVSVALEGATPDKAVSLLGVGGRAMGASTPTGQDGIARFSDLEPGVYAAEAEGFARTEFTLAAGVEQLVTLPTVAQGTLSVRAPPGFRFSDAELRQTLSAGVHRDALVGLGAYRVFLEAVRIVAGQETIVDLAPSDGGSLLIRGPPGTRVELLLRQPDATLSFVAQFEGEERAFRFPVLPPGSYAVRTSLRRLTIEIAAGDTAVLNLGTAEHSVADRVVLWNGKPAQGVEVRLFPADDEGRERSLLMEIVADEDDRTRSVLTDLRGRFRFADVRSGEYTCVARLEGYAPASGTISVGSDGVVTEGLPLILARSAGRHAQLRGLAGEPLRHVPVLVDGHWQTSDVLGRLLLHTVPARIDLDLEGFASIRDLEVRPDDEIRLQRGANLVVLTDPEIGAPTVRVGGRPWRRLRPAPLADDPVPGRLVLEDLPPGPVEIRLPAPPPAEGDEEPPEPPEPVLAQLESGGQTTVDLRPR